MPMQEVMFINPRRTGHLPWSIIFVQKEYKRSKQFRFLKYLAKHKKFHKLMVVAQGRKTNTSAMIGIWQKLRDVKQMLKTIHSTEFK